MSEPVPQDNLPEISTEGFQGPLDLLCYLIEKNKINIYDIPIAEITDQYLEYLNSLSVPDMNLASEFLVMASTLLIIKSKLLLPDHKAGTEEYSDPREELVLKILEYRRCKNLAEVLKIRGEKYSDLVYSLPVPPSELGVTREYNPEIFDRDEFLSAARNLNNRNKLRFNDISAKITKLLERDRVSIKNKMKMIWNKISVKTKVFFNEIFPSDKTNKMERVVGFLALLELLKVNLLKVEQKKTFGAISIMPVTEGGALQDKRFEDMFSEKDIEEMDYQ